MVQNQDYFTGVAILNINSEPAHVVVRVFSTEGEEVGTGAVMVPANGRVSRLLSQIVPALPPMSKGNFRVSSDKPVLSFGVFGTHTLSVLSAVLAQPPV